MLLNIVTKTVDTSKVKQVGSILLQRTNPEKTDVNEVVIKYITTIGSQWPFLLVLFLIIFFLFYRKRFESFFSKTTSIKGGAAGISIEVIQDTAVKNNDETDIAISNKNLDISVVDESIPLISDTEITATKEHRLFDVYISLSKQDLQKAIEIFTEIQTKQRDPEEIEKNKIIFQFYKYINGYSDSLTEINQIKEITTHSKIRIIADRYTGMCYAYSLNYEKAIYMSLKAIAKAKEEGFTDIKIDILLEISESFEKTNQWMEYIKLILSEIDDDTSEENLFKLYKKISSVYEKNGLKIESATFLLKASGYINNDTGTLFDTAYKFSDLEFNELSLQLYDLLTNINGNHASAFNNLGVAYEKLEVKSKATMFYKRSFELDNTLAASNIAYKYIHVGLFVEARQILNEVKSKYTNIDPNIWKAFDKIEEELKAEKEKEKEIQKRAFLTKDFFKYYGDAIIKSWTETHDLVLSDFYLEDDEAVMNEEGNSLKIDLENSYLEIRILTRDKTFGSCTVIESNKSGKSYKNDSYKGYFCLIDNKLRVLVKYEHFVLRQEFRYLELVRKQQLLLETTKQEM